MSLVEIGRHFGVTRQGIWYQFLKNGVDPHTVGIKIRTKLNREEYARRVYNKMGDRTQELYREKKQKFRAKKANARRNGQEFWIDFVEIDWPTHCPVLGIELDYLSEGRQENSVSFDRIDNTEGYVSGNVVITSWRANRIKNDGTPQEHQLIADFYKK